VFKEKVLQRRPGIVTFGLTPPKESHPPEKIAEIAARQMERLRSMQVDGLVIYDVQNEADRTAETRPFPYLPTVDPSVYSKKYLRDLSVPQIIYRSVGRDTPDTFREWLTSDCASGNCVVLVGAASSNQRVSLRLSEAYRIARSVKPDLVIGGVTIPERHLKRQDEHIRVRQKMADGCRFFISQAVYNVETARNFLSDYYYDCQANGIAMAPILFTLTPCGSMKTLEFMKWLGISIPRWLENDLLHSTDILGQSIQQAKQTFANLVDFSVTKGIPIGCNVESISTRKVEIDGAVELAGAVRSMIRKASPGNA
jgi:hypothetical protein